MDRNHLLMPVDRLSVAAAAGMSHSWDQQRSASQPLSPLTSSPFPPSPILPASSSLSSPPPTPFYLLPPSPLPAPQAGVLAAVEFDLLQVPSSRFALPPRRARSEDSGRAEDENERLASSPSTSSTSDSIPSSIAAYSPVSSHSSSASFSPLTDLSLSEIHAMRAAARREKLHGPSAALPLSPASDVSPMIAGQRDIDTAGVTAPDSTVVRNNLDPASCYPAFTPSTLVADSDSLHPPRRPTPRTILWPSLSPLNLPPVSALASLTFNCLDYTDDQLLVYTLHTFDHLNLVSTLNLSLPHLQTFLLSVRAHYRVNPYHNWYHGFHVFQFGFYMLTTSRLQQLLTPLDQLALLISCLCHDVDHPGTTNDFQIAIDSGLARIHNEIAVLENHHAFMTCEILRHPQCNFFTAFSAQQLRGFRKVVVAAILATDMAVHFDLCRQFRRLDTDLGEYQREKEDDRQLVINLVVHSSDLSAQVMDFAIASLWEARVTAEFMAQNEMEQTLGVPVTPLMIGLHDHQKRYEKHLGFLHYVMQPLWDVVSDVLPPMQQCVESLNNNKEKYRQRLKEVVGERDEERQPLNSSTASSSGPSSVASSSSSSIVVSVTVTPSATSTPTPDTVSPRHSGVDTTSGTPTNSTPSTPPRVYHILRDDDEAEAGADRSGKDER